MRQIFLDTETTGLNPEQGHKIIEIGCVEMVGRRLTGKHYHQYLKPNREIDDGAVAVHGITNEFLADKPTFDQIADEFLAFVKDAELIIHNAPFDVGFINSEFSLLARKDLQPITKHCRIIDTLLMAREKHPGQKNNLDALCRRYEVNNTHRDLHGALLDAEILADVYLRMTGGQVGLALAGNSSSDASASGVAGVGLASIQRLPADRKPLTVLAANAEELAAHEAYLQILQKKSDEKCVWLREC